MHVHTLYCLLIKGWVWSQTVVHFILIVEGLAGEEQVSKE